MLSMHLQRAAATCGPDDFRAAAALELLLPLLQRLVTGHYSTRVVATVAALHYLAVWATLATVMLALRLLQGNCKHRD